MSIRKFGERFPREDRISNPLLDFLSSELGGARMGSLSASRFERLRRWSGRATESESARAGRELDLVHRTELARLLRIAAELRLSHLRDRSWSENEQLPGLGDWRLQAGIETLLAFLDDFEGAELELLADCVLSSLRDWPDARELVECSLTVEDSEQGRLELARVHLAQGAPGSALKVLSCAMRRGISGPNQWRLYAGLGRAHELCGGDRLALESFRLASGRVGCSASPRVDGLFLALTLGDVGVARDLARQLNLGRHSAGQIHRSSACLMRRLEERSAPGSWKPSDHESSQLFRDWCRRDAGPVSKLCRELAVFVRPVFSGEGD